MSKMEVSSGLVSIMDLRIPNSTSRCVSFFLLRRVLLDWANFKTTTIVVKTWFYWQVWFRMYSKRLMVVTAASLELNISWQREFVVSTSNGRLCVKSKLDYFDPMFEKLAIVPNLPPAKLWKTFHIFLQWEVRRSFENRHFQCHTFVLRTKQSPTHVLYENAHILACSVSFESEDCDARPYLWEIPPALKDFNTLFQRWEVRRTFSIRDYATSLTRIFAQYKQRMLSDEVLGCTIR